MADTTQWSLQQCANAAGTRTEPYPEQTIAAPPHVCRGCGTPLHGARSRNTQALRVYCSSRCMRHAASRFNVRIEDDRSLELTQYYWSEW